MQFITDCWSSYWNLSTHSLSFYFLFIALCRGPLFGRGWGQACKNRNYFFNSHKTHIWFIIVANKFISFPASVDSLSLFLQILSYPRSLCAGMANNFLIYVVGFAAKALRDLVFYLPLKLKVIKRAFVLLLFTCALRWGWFNWIWA